MAYIFYYSLLNENTPSFIPYNLWMKHLQTIRLKSLDWG